MRLTMRLVTRLASLALVLCFAGAAHAQSGLFTTPRNLTYTPIDTSKALNTQVSASRALKLPSQSNVANKPFNIGNVFPKISLGNWPPKTPQVSVLPQSQNIFQPNTPVQQGAVNLMTPPAKK